MKTKIQFLGLNAHPGWNGLVKQQLKHLEGLIPITAANVVMEHWREITPAFRVRVRLEVSGPALHAEAFDHTLEAALLLTTYNLQHQIEGRQISRREQRKGHLRLMDLSAGHRKDLSMQLVPQSAAETKAGHALIDDSFPDAPILFAEPQDFSRLTERMAATRVEPEDLSRFEGEGGPEVPAAAAPPPKQQKLFPARKTKKGLNPHSHSAN